MGAYSRWALIRGLALIKFSPFSASEVCLFCNKTINANNSKVSVKYSEENSVLGLLLEFIHSSRWGGGERLFDFDWEEEGVGAYSRLSAY